jgi:hypothetical protein
MYWTPSDGMQAIFTDDIASNVFDLSRDGGVAGIGQVV